MSALKVVCLISGGKDSLFSILHCQQNGHEVIALANLHPPANDNHEAAEDLDSFMYQTIGHGIIPLYEQALDLPVYRQAISGSAINQDKSYRVTDLQDETEDLIPLLNKVKLHHPDLNAVSTGAILSDYQRTRVESVAIRLGLTPLSYLWQWPNLRPHTQESLLEDMAVVGLDARIIKVASGGLDESVLWHNVADPETVNRLGRAAKRFGSGDDGAVLGEGGEYETLAIAGPPSLWKGHIQVDEGKWVIVPGDAGSASVRVLEARLAFDPPAADSSAKLPIPPLLEPEFQQLLRRMLQKIVEGDRTTGDGPVSASPAIPTALSRENAESLVSALTGDGGSAAEQMHSIMKQAISILHDTGSGLSLKDVAYTSIILRDMADFASVNEIYGAYFSHPNPPARATLACADVVPQGKDVSLSMTVNSKHGRQKLKGLHVQSRSYWAPANIGPYSQAMTHFTTEDAAIVYVAGQIPLVPATMQPTTTRENPEEVSFLFQAVLALQHLDRIGRAMRAERWGCAIAFVVAPTDEQALLQCECVCQVWDAYCQAPESKDDNDSESDDNTFDVWHGSFGAERAIAGHSKPISSPPLITPNRSYGSPPMYVVRVDALPRGVSVEWVPFGLLGKVGQPYTIPHLDHLLDSFRNRIIMRRT